MTSQNDLALVNLVIPDDKVDDVVISLVSVIEQSLNGQQLSSVNALDVCVRVMQLLETYPNMKGLQREKAMMDTFTYYISKNNLNQDLIPVIQSFIHIGIAIDKGTINIAQIKSEEVASCCLTACLAGLNAYTASKKV